MLNLALTRLRIPDLSCVLVNTPIRAEETHPRHNRDRLREPLILILIRLVDKILRLDVALEVVGDEVVVTVISNAVD